jgi:hypothetical protein
VGVVVVCHTASAVGFLGLKEQIQALLLEV